MQDKGNTMLTPEWSLRNPLLMRCESFWSLSVCPVKHSRYPVSPKLLPNTSFLIAHVRLRLFPMSLES
jgi:hypothetical protein